MTEYRIDCRSCTNKAISMNGDIYCLPTIQGKDGIYIDPGHSGRRNDPDPICCDYFTREPRQIVIYETEVKG